MNDLANLKEVTQLSYGQIAQRIRESTGRKYSRVYLGNVARGAVRISDGLRYNLLMTFPDFYLPQGTQISGTINCSVSGG